ncbi:DNA cytosine methyltransferase [Brochothrix thermosphacta]|nr:DNA cytosine methyltransferase [Brochothrix thermosphacta]MDO7864786.1 DNA cytosine methyltransferase [Brochothrix thermosphacta]
MEAFSGIGSQRLALKRANIPHKSIGVFEVDSAAIESYKAIHGDIHNLGDISKISEDEIPDHDLFTYSFPCQDISKAGRQAGLKKGSNTRSGLLWECERIIQKKKPRFLLLENVPNLVAKKHKPDFILWLEWLESQGYTNYWSLLNGVDYNIPQNRSRVFVVSILGEHKPFKFPTSLEQTKQLKDLLEEDVDEKYFLTEEQQKELMYYIQPSDSESYIYIKNATKKGYLKAREFDGIDLAYPNSKTRRGRVQKSRTQTLMTGDSLGVLIGKRIRRLTSLERWRLMGFSDEDYQKASTVCSQAQLGKQAGNSIIVDILEEIFKEVIHT